MLEGAGTMALKTQCPDIDRSICQAGFSRYTSRLSHLAASLLSKTAHFDNRPLHLLRENQIEEATLDGVDATDYRVETLAGGGKSLIERREPHQCEELRLQIPFPRTRSADPKTLRQQFAGATSSSH